MLGLIDESLGMPLDGGEKGKCRVLEAFDDAIGGGGDNAEAAAEAVGGLFVIAVDGNLGLADGAADWEEGSSVTAWRGMLSPILRCSIGWVAGNVGEELVHAAAAIDVHELRAEADAQGGQAAFFDLGQEGQFEISGGRDRCGSALGCQDWP